MKKIKLTSLLLFFVLWILSGCNRKQKNEIVIGASMLSLQAEFVVNVKDAMEARAKEKNIKLIVTDAQLTAEKQVQQIETFISQKVDAIILNPCEVEASSPAVDNQR
jgi:inositol transport system substrate-binding protein